MCLGSLRPGSSELVQAWAGGVTSVQSWPLTAPSGASNTIFRAQNKMKIWDLCSQSRKKGVFFPFLRKSLNFSLHYLLFDVVLRKLKLKRISINLITHLYTMLVINANIRAFNVYAEPPELHRLYFIAGTCIYILFLLEQWKCTIVTQEFLFHRLFFHCSVIYCHDK